MNRYRSVIGRLTIRLAFFAFFVLIALTLFSPAADADEVEYTLGPGDKLRITVFGEEDLSGEFEVTGNARVSLPLIGEVIVGGKTLRTAERLIEEKLRDGYLKEPQVSIDVLNYRPFFILGEVKKPGKYPYVNGMTVLNAVAMAEGFTHRADEKDIMVRRSGDRDEEGRNVGLNEKVFPGDIIKVEERFF